MRSRHGRWAVLLVTAATALGACATPSGPAPSAIAAGKVGGAAGPIAITIADSQHQGHPSNAPLTEFKRQVESQSGGSMGVTILTNASPDGDPPGSDVPVIEKVKSAEFEMAVVPARAWSAAGVQSLKALQAPFLFESDDQVTAALRDESITTRLLSGFEGSGITGLVLFPESLRHLFSFGEPMLTPDDVRGRTIKAISSLETTALIEALGGVAVDPTDDAFQQGIDDGTIHGADSGFTLATVSPSLQHSTATGNVALYAKVLTVVVNTAFWAGLDDSQRGIVKRASEALRDWAIANEPADAAAAVEFCAAGGRVVLAKPSSIAAFRAAEQPVYDALAADPVAGEAIAAIRALAPPVDAPGGVQACQHLIDGSELEADGGTLPDGIYRIEATEEYLRDHYPDYLASSVGIYDFTLDGGHWQSEYTSPGGGTDRQSGIYRVEGHDMYWLWDPCCSHPNPVLHLTWSVGGDGTLHFVQLTGPDDWALKLPFRRIGDLP